MWVRLLLQPWWVRAVPMAIWILIVGFAGVAYFRQGQGSNPNPLGLSVPTIAVIAVTCIGLGGLFAALSIRTRNLYLEALGELAPAERSQAITATWHGPVPDDQRVREAADRVARLRLTVYRRNPRTYRVVYPLLSSVWLVLLVLNFTEQARGAWFFGSLAVLSICGTVWALLTWRQLEHRVKLLNETQSASGDLPATDQRAR